MLKSGAFIYSAYWRMWSRRLADNHPHGPFVEVNLTPIPSCRTSSWENTVKPIIIRTHCTGSDPWRDQRVQCLPRDAVMMMRQNLGEELTSRLLEEDFLPLIDWEVYSRVSGGRGGVPLVEILKK